MKKLTAEDLERSRLPREHWGATLSQVPEPARGVISNYLNPKNDFLTNGTGLYLAGETGVGKTAAACVIAKVLRAMGRTVYFTTPFDLREANKNKVNFDEDLSITYRCKTVDVLILDQWDEADMKDYYVGSKFVSDLLRHRRSYGLPTIVTSRDNLGDQELVSAATGYLVPVVLTGPDQRQGKAAALAKALFKTK